VRWSVFVRDGGVLELPVCTSVGGSVFVREGGVLELPVCTSVGWSVFVYTGGKLDLPDCTSVGWYVEVREGGKLELPLLPPFFVDPRGYWAYLINGRIKAGCHDFSLEEGLAHWGSVDYPDKVRGDACVKAINKEIKNEA
jgi:hypothetical protein